jgi:malonate transporter and related proteins
MSAIVNVVLPVFAIILIGYLAGRYRLLGAASSEALNLFVYWIALPVLLFHSLARVRPEQIFNGPFLLAYLGGQAVILIGGALVAFVLFRRPIEEASLFAMSGAFGNTGYMGIPLAMAAFGDAAGLPAAIATVFGTALIIAAATICIELGLTVHGRPYRHVLADVGTALVRNPLIIASLMGIVWSLLDVPLWAPLDRLCGILGAAAGPCALVAIGLFLVGKPIGSGAAETAAMVTLKLVVHPLLTGWLALFVFDVDPLWATVAILMAALPTGANAFVLAQRYGVYVERVSTATLISTVLAVLTLSLLFAMPELWTR